MNILQAPNVNLVGVVVHAFKLFMHFVSQNYLKQKREFP